MRGRPTPIALGRHIGVSLAILSTLVLVACDDGTTAEPPTSTAAPKPDASAYHTALASVLDDPPPPPDGERTVVFLVPLGEAIGIDTQAAVIDSFADAYDVRFVDDLAAAIVKSDPAHPPRDDGTVLGIGTIDREPPHLVRLEHYRSVDDVDAVLLTLEFRDDRWVVAITEPVPAEVLADAGD